MHNREYGFCLSLTQTLFHFWIILASLVAFIHLKVRTRKKAVTFVVKSLDDARVNVASCLVFVPTRRLPNCTYFYS